MKRRKQASVDRSTPPPPGVPGKVGFPRYSEKKLRNGFKIFVIENHSLPIVTIGFVVRGGSMYDGDRPGLASITSELLTKGTKTRSATEIAEQIDFVGGSLASSASWDACQVFVSVLKEYVTVGFDLLEDVVLNPTFPEEEIERVRTQRLASIQQLKADSGYLADTKFAEVLFKMHPYGKPPGGTEKSVKELKRSDFRLFHDNLFTPLNSFIVFAGDILPKEAEQFSAGVFGKWKRKSKPAAVKSPGASEPRKGIVIIEKPDAVQSALRIGHVGIARRNPDYLKVFVMNTLLGGYFSSRINMNLREVHGYTYGGRSSFDARTLPGVFEVSADVRNEVTLETIDEIFAELNRIVRALPTKSELEMVKNYLVGLFPIQLETPQQVASRIIVIELFNLPKNYYRDYRGNIRRVTAAGIRAAAAKYIHPENCAIVLSGNSAEIKNKLKKFGQIQIFDRDGNKLNDK